MKSPRLKFIADINVGKLAKWLRIMGYDTLIFKGSDDSDMLTAAMAEDRILLSRDSRLMERRLVTGKRVQAMLITSDDPDMQLKQVIEALGLSVTSEQIGSLCIECNEPLVAKSRGEVKASVPEYVFKTQQEYMECPSCCRIYWKGTHWQAMMDKMKKFS